MKLLSNGLTFIVRTALLKNKQQGDAATLSTPLAQIPVTVYLPKGKEKGLILTFTGFSMTGYQDQRMVVVNNALASLGFRVITPKIDTIDALTIDPRGVDEVKAAIEHICKCNNLNPHQFKPGVFAPSFTAGIASLAIAELPPQTISSLCLLGTFSDFESTIEFAIANDNNEDDYGMHILLKNFLPFSSYHSPELALLVQTALEDNGLKRSTPLLPEVLTKVPSNIAQTYLELKENREQRLEVLREAWINIPHFEAWKHRLDLSKHAHKITCPVSIIHGKEDKVIAPEQSVLLHQLMTPHNAQVNLELSSLLDHGDPKVGLGILKDVSNLSKAFGYFIRHVSQA